MHINLSYFDTIKEITLTIPKKILKPEEKIAFLPVTLKEIQQKMIYYQKENRKYKIKNKSENDSTANNVGFYEYYVKKEKEKEEENNKSCQQSLINETNDTSNNNSITSVEKKKKKIKKKKKRKSAQKEEQNNNDENESNIVNSFF